MSFPDYNGGAQQAALKNKFLMRPFSSSRMQNIERLAVGIIRAPAGVVPQRRQVPWFMDFGNKDIPNVNQFYNLSPRKPVVEQTVDLFNGIRKYCEKELYLERGIVVVSGKM